MSTEANQAAPAPGVGAEYDPFDQKNMATGGGLWDGKTVTITRAVAGIKALVHKDGKPVMDPKTKKQSTIIGLLLDGIAEGEDKERSVEYTCGTKLQPDADGESFNTKDGTVPQFHVNSALGKLSLALQAAGFPMRELLASPAKYVGQQKWSALVGAQITFKGESKIGKDGKALQNDKGYDKQTFLPVKLSGAWRASWAEVWGAPKAQDALVQTAEATVIEVLAAAEGQKLTLAQLVQAVATKLAGSDQATSNGVIGHIVRDDFHKGRPWKYEDGVASL